jgi:hypothetical protein
MARLRKEAAQTVQAAFSPRLLAALAGDGGKVVVVVLLLVLLVELVVVTEVVVSVVLVLLEVLLVVLVAWGTRPLTTARGSGKEPWPGPAGCPAPP